MYIFVDNFPVFKCKIKNTKSHRVPWLEGNHPWKRWWWWEAPSQLLVSKLQLPSNPTLIPHPPNTHIHTPSSSAPPSSTPVSNPEILSELIPGNVYFEEQIVALLLAQCIYMEVETGIINSPMVSCMYTWSMQYFDLTSLNTTYLQLTRVVNISVCKSQTNMVLVNR